MWVFCCGMRRSASTLQYQIAADLVTRKNLGIALGYVQHSDFETLKEKYKDDKRLKIVKTHAFLPSAGSLIRAGHGKALFSYRDVRDAFVSFMTISGTSFSEQCDQGLIFALLKEYEEWTAVESILISKYEKLMSDLAGEIRKIAVYLGIRLEEEEVASMAADYSLERQRKRVHDIWGDSPGSPAENSRQDAKTLLHPNHIQSGAAGVWKGVLTRKEVALIEYIAADWMRNVGYPFSQNWFVRMANGVAFHLRHRISKRFRPGPQTEDTGNSEPDAKDCQPSKRC